ncbi:uncharacterized protein MONBRDRAFT_26531 [Monosiga brevicollis MX1]|uniref:C2 domain-containing protein n=1 Tax=Monosiga brevicollis TaxID=81824 RepID=A9V2M7_MONBE|nr:uncharacterized protein MONBRDRAFT_26531 [Monosiga brevicollis MX1]EDQ88285.1 predicted protein [Monosiga brevicollis MX1]|eukprot:XP_001746878.1 hypothetical protein [Monosiga brevicollis MX1]
MSLRATGSSAGFAYKASTAMALPDAAPGAMPSSRLQLHIACKDLTSMDTFSKSDPYVVMQLKDARGQFVEVGRTEVQGNKKSPTFATVLEVDYLFETIQQARFIIYDHDKDGKPDSEQDLIGQVETHLGEIVGLHRGHMVVPIRKSASSKSERGTLIVDAEESADVKGIVHLTLQGQDLDKKDFFGKSDPYFILSRQLRGSWRPIFKSEVIKKTLNPTWKTIQLPRRAFGNGGPDDSVRIEVYDWDRNGKHDFIGKVQVTLRELFERPDASQQLQLINPDKKKHAGKAGLLNMKVHVEPEYTFVDYLRGGHELHFQIAVDFTASNGDPRMPSSLHYMNPMSPNQYQQAIMAIGQVIQDYDTDKQFPCFGFGAKSGETVLPIFALNGNMQQPYCDGIDGMIAAYQQGLLNVTLWGPTNFAPIIAQAAQVARDHSQFYHVLLILTDGAVSDFNDTAREIVAASSLPLSIIIVGVGNADFGMMEQLDGDEVPLTYQGRQPERDIVQFVPFRKFSQGPGAQSALAQPINKAPYNFCTARHTLGIPRLDEVPVKKRYTL